LVTRPDGANVTLTVAMPEGSPDFRHADASVAISERALVAALLSNSVIAGSGSAGVGVAATVVVVARFGRSARGAGAFGSVARADRGGGSGGTGAGGGSEGAVAFSGSGDSGTRASPARCGIVGSSVAPISVASLGTAASGGGGFGTPGLNSANAAAEPAIRRSAKSTPPVRVDFGGFAGAARTPRDGVVSGATLPEETGEPAPPSTGGGMSASRPARGIESSIGTSCGVSSASSSVLEACASSATSPAV